MSDKTHSNRNENQMSDPTHEEAQNELREFARLIFGTNTNDDQEN